MRKHKSDQAQRDALNNSRLKNERHSLAIAIVQVLSKELNGFTAMELHSMEQFKLHMKSTIQARLSELSGMADPLVIKSEQRRMGGAGVNIHIWQTPNNYIKSQRINKATSQLLLPL